MQFGVTACQLEIDSCFDAAGSYVPARVHGNLERACEVIRTSWRESGSRLFLLPQFSLHGFSFGRSAADWVGASTRIPGPETHRIGELAREIDVYIAGTLFEVLSEFPGRFFLTGFIIGPSGDCILRYRKLYAFSWKTRPGDIYDQYVACFGRRSFFPVVTTPLGRLGMAIAGDVNWPEMTRALALRGAEIILNPMATAMQAGDRDTAVGAVQAVRAFENVCYVVVANAGPLHGAGPMPEARLRSRVLDFEGRALAVAGSDGADTVSATIDLTALRQWRGRPMKNFIAQLQPHLHADDYLEARLWPKGLAAASDVPLDMFAIERDVWRSMVASGRFEGEAGAD